MTTSALKPSLERIVRPLFAKAATSLPNGFSLPAVVVQNRKDRAFDRIVQALESRGSQGVPRELRADLGRLLTQWSRRCSTTGSGPWRASRCDARTSGIWCLATESGDQPRILAALERDLRRRVMERFGRIEIRGHSDERTRPAEPGTYLHSVACRRTAFASGDSGANGNLRPVPADSGCRSAWRSTAAGDRRCAGIGKEHSRSMAGHASLRR